MDSWCKNLDLLIKSRTPLIWITTKEEERLKKILENCFKQLFIKRFIIWDCVNGLKGVLNDEGKFANNPLGALNWIKEQDTDYSTILLVKDFNKYIDDPSISRTIKELYYSLKKTKNNLIFSSHSLPSSEEIDDLLCIINLPLPGQNELVNLKI